MPPDGSQMQLLDRPHSDVRQGQRTVLLPWLIVLFIGSAALGLKFLIGPALSGERYYKVAYHATPYMYVKEMLILFIPYGLALWAWRKGKRVPVFLLLGGAVILHLIVLFAPPPQSQDIWSYLFYGRIQAAHGANPYVAVPSQFWADPWFPWTRWHDAASVYGPVWMLITWGVAKTAGNSMTLAFVEMKLVILAIDLTVMGLLIASGRSDEDRKGASGWALLLFAWNPVVLVSVPLAGAADVWLAAMFIGAVLARRKGRTGLATVLLTLAALVKVYALIALGLHLVLVWRERRSRGLAKHAGLSIGLAALAFAPYWAGLRTFKALGRAADLANLSFTGTLQRMLAVTIHHFGSHHGSHIARMVIRAIVVPILLGFAVWAVRKVRDERSLWWATLVFLTAYLYLSPWFLYWYVVSALALVAVLPINPLTYPLVTFSASSLITVWFRPQAVGQLTQTSLRYLPPVAVFLKQRKPAALRRRGGLPVAIPVPSSGPATATAPATSSAPATAPAPSTAPVAK
jgi:Glycosyltransferase family 87